MASRGADVRVGTGGEGEGEGEAGEAVKAVVVAAVEVRPAEWLNHSIIYLSPIALSSAD